MNIIKPIEKLVESNNILHVYMGVCLYLLYIGIAGAMIFGFFAVTIYLPLWAACIVQFLFVSSFITFLVFMSR